MGFANVGVQGTTLGAGADEDGQFVMTLEAGTYTLVVSAVGFSKGTQTIILAEGESRQVTVELDAAMVESEAVVVTGTMKETFLSESPVKVDVISARYLENLTTSNLMDVISNVNGLYQQIDCGVCYTNNIRINGMEGPYTAVLIDGMPVMSSLASVYGLNGISPAAIQQVEVIKGPVSTLYGTEAMGGVVNIITKKPSLAPRLSVNTFVTTHQEVGMDFSHVQRAGRWTSMLTGNGFYNGTFHDENHDGFSDTPLTRRVSLFGKGALNSREGMKMLDVSAKYYYEDRFGGVAGWNDNMRGSSEVYGESILTHRVEVLGTYRPSWGQGRARADFAYNYHDQDSFYGDVPYAAQQQVYFTNLVWNPRVGKAHDVLLGTTLRYQTYDDNTPATAARDRRFIPGLFVQNETILSPALRVLGGLRVDHHKKHGFIWSPRLSAKYSPLSYTTFRLNGGTGFRVVNLFTEDHAALTGSREVVILEDLEPERSLSGTVSVQQILPLGTSPVTIDVDGFYTHFTNQIIPDYDTDPNLIVYQNLDEASVTRGVSFSFSQNFADFPLSYTLGTTLMDVFRQVDGGKEAIEFAPDYQGIVNANYNLDRWNINLGYTANLTGPMALPEFEEPFARPTRSEPFMIHNLMVTKDVRLKDGSLLQVYFSLENITDFTQDSPLIDPAHPFGDAFDTTYVYAPVHGREVGLGIRLNMR